MATASLLCDFLSPWSGWVATVTALVGVAFLPLLAEFLRFYPPRGVGRGGFFSCLASPTFLTLVEGKFSLPEFWLGALNLKILETKF